MEKYLRATFKYLPQQARSFRAFRRYVEKELNRRYVEKELKKLNESDDRSRGN